MSGWQAYVDNNLVKSGHITKAGIFGLDGNPWAQSPGLGVQPAQVKALVAGFADSSKLTGEGGLHLGAEKYIVLRADNRSVYGKKGSNGVVAVKTKQAVIIGFYDQTIQPGAAANTVEKLADYLIGQNY
jgi:profilin